MYYNVHSMIVHKYSCVLLFALKGNFFFWDKPDQWMRSLRCSDQSDNYPTIWCNTVYQGPMNLMKGQPDIQIYPCSLKRSIGHADGTCIC